VLGIVSAAGSLGALLSAPIGQLLNEGYGWRIGMAGFVILSVAMLSAAWFRRPGRQGSVAASDLRRIAIPRPRWR